jgi:aspartate carbamoyltransferase catalytic subunit
MMEFNGSDIISTENMSRGDIDRIIDVAKTFLPVASKEKSSNLLAGKVLAALFYEPSTRTRLSFETAMLRLGGSVINVIGMESSSLAKGETLYDTAKVVENFADVVAMRHPREGSVSEVAAAAGIPVINAGDGPGQHPTQAFLDAFTIVREKGRIDGLTIAFVGDLKYGRTVHSLAYLLSHYGVKLVLVSPDKLKMPNEVIEHLKRKKIVYSETEKLEDALRHADVIYSTRVQRERFVDLAEYERFKLYYVLTRQDIEKHNGKMTILHPLPRVGEISLDVDELPGAAYFRQVRNGVAVRMALLALVLGKV